MCNWTVPFFLIMVTLSCCLPCSAAGWGCAFALPAALWIGDAPWLLKLSLTGVCWLRFYHWAGIESCGLYRWPATQNKVEVMTAIVRAPTPTSSVWRTKMRPWRRGLQILNYIFVLQDDPTEMSHRSVRYLKVGSRREVTNGTGKSLSLSQHT